MSYNDVIMGAGIAVTAAVLWFVLRNLVKRPLLSFGSEPVPNGNVIKFLSDSLTREQKNNIELGQQLQAIKEDLAAQKIYSEKLNDKIETQQAVIDDLQQQLKICNDIKDMMVRQMFSKENTTPLQREKANKLHDLICKHLSLDEFKTVCFRMDIQYNSLEGGDRLPAKALALIQYVMKRDRVNELIEQLFIINDKAAWPI